MCVCVSVCVSVCVRVCVCECVCECVCVCTRLFCEPRPHCACLEHEGYKDNFSDYSYTLLCNMNTLPAVRDTKFTV